MKKYDNAADFARDTGVPNAALVETLSEHNKYALGELKDPFGKGVSRDEYWPFQSLTSIGSPLP